MAKTPMINVRAADPGRLVPRVLNVGPQISHDEPQLVELDEYIYRRLLYAELAVVDTNGDKELAEDLRARGIPMPPAAATKKRTTKGDE